MDLSHDFTDWSGPDGKVVEVRNTFLHVRAASGENNIQAAARSDFVCNYRGYPDLAQVSESSAPAAKSRNRRPGKKARARIQRRNSTVQSLNSISTICTEASGEPQSEVSEYRMSSPAQSDTAVSESTVADDCVSRCSSEASTTVPMPGSKRSVADADEDGRCVAVVDDCMSRTTSATSLTMQSLRSKSFDQTMAGESPQECTFRVKAIWFAAAFVLGALTVTVLLGLVWSSGAVQFSFGRMNYPDHMAQHALDAFKEEAEKRLTSQERMLKDILAKVQMIQPKDDAPGLQQDLMLKILDMRASLGESEKLQTGAVKDELEISTRLSSPHEKTDAPLATTKSDSTTSGTSPKDDIVAEQHLTQEIGRSLDPSNDVPNNSEVVGWVSMKSIFVAWLSMVAVCSMFQPPLLATIKGKVQ